MEKQNFSKIDDLKRYIKYMQERKSLIEMNLRFSQQRLDEGNRLAIERGIKQPIIVPEGYMDIDKMLNESIEISKKQIKECEEEIDYALKVMKKIYTN